MAMNKGADGLYTMDSMSQVLRKNGKENTKQVSNINDFISRVKKKGQDTTQLYNELSQVQSVDELRALEKKYLGENSVSKDVDISNKGSDNEMFKSLQDWQKNLAGQEEVQGGKQIANTNAAVAAAKPGDWFIRSNGQMVVLNEDHIKWAQRLFPDKYPNTQAAEQATKEIKENMPNDQPTFVDAESDNAQPTDDPNAPKVVKSGKPVVPKEPSKKEQLVKRIEQLKGELQDLEAQYSAM